MNLFMARFKYVIYLSYYSVNIFRILPSVVAFRISAASISFRGGFFNNCVNAALLLFSSASKSGLIPGCLCIMADSTKMDKSCKANYTNIQIFIFWRGSYYFIWVGFIYFNFLTFTVVHMFGFCQFDWLCSEVDIFTHSVFFLITNYQRWFSFGNIKDMLLWY